MGTSSSYGGPVDSQWKKAKRLARRLASREQTVQPRAVVQAYIEASGGAAAFASAALEGRRVVQHLVAFMSSVQSQGFEATLQRGGLGHLVGQDAQTVLAELLDYFTGPGSLLEEAAARKAVQELLEELLSGIDDWDDLARILAELELSRVIRRFIALYVLVRITQDLGLRLESGAETPENLEATYQEMLEFIDEMVRLDTEGVSMLEVDWAGAQGLHQIDTWLEESFGLLEAD